MDDIAAFKLDSLPDITFTVTRAISSGGENPAGFLNFAARREQPEILGGGGRPGPVGPEAVDTPRIRGGRCRSSSGRYRVTPSTPAKSSREWATRKGPHSWLDSAISLRLRSGRRDGSASPARGQTTMRSWNSLDSPGQSPNQAMNEGSATATNLDRQEWRTEASLDVGRPENAPRNETLVRTKILRSSGSTREHVVRPVGMGAGKVLQPGDGRRRVQTWLLSAG